MKLTELTELPPSSGIATMTVDSLPQIAKPSTSSICSQVKSMSKCLGSAGRPLQQYHKLHPEITSPLRIPLYRNGFYEIEIIATPIDSEFGDVKIDSPQAMADFMYEHVDWEKLRLKEHFYVVSLNRANRIILVHLLSIGSMHGTVADSIDVVRIGLMSFASTIVICHNHPSGNMVPSESDKKLTRGIKEACKSVGLELTDSLIIGESLSSGLRQFYSFREEGLI